MSIKQTTASLANLHPNPWNPNKMNERVFEAERESIGRFGFIDPITVRVHPELEDAYQIIDGEHRWRVATDLKLKKVPICIIEASDVEAKKLTIILNETRGEADTVDLGTLLAEIQLEDPDLLEALPYTQIQLDNLVALASLEIPDYEVGTDNDEVATGDTSEWTTINVRVPHLVQRLFQQTKDTIDNRLGGLHEEEDIASGQVLEILCAEYLAGN